MVVLLSGSIFQRCVKSHALPLRLSAKPTMRRLFIVNLFCTISLCSEIGGRGASEHSRYALQRHQILSLFPPFKFHVYRRSVPDIGCIPRNSPTVAGRAGSTRPAAMCGWIRWIVRTVGCAVNFGIVCTLFFGSHS
jgi:hypothetical protein